ncbi:16807_t:CDS:1, partial [Gigaspora rosea]
LQTSSRLPNYFINLFDVQNYAWVSSSQPNRHLQSLQQIQIQHHLWVKEQVVL